MFKQARWDEPTIFEMGRPGSRGYTLPKLEKEIVEAVKSPEEIIPEKMRRKNAPKLPELSEVEVVRHFTRLSQMNYGVDSGLYPLGSCTMKYNPKVNEVLARHKGIAWIHPYQDESTVQGILEILYRLSRWLAEITGTKEVCLQPPAIAALAGFVPCAESGTIISLLSSSSPFNL